jgi:hypothetical protein
VNDLEAAAEKADLIVKVRSFVSWIGGRDHADDNAELSDLGQYAIRFLLDLA